MQTKLIQKVTLCTVAMLLLTGTAGWSACRSYGDNPTARVAAAPRWEGGDESRDEKQEKGGDDGVPALLEEIQSDDFTKRENAQKKLAAMGSKIVPLLKRALETTKSEDARQRLAKLIEESAF